MLISVDLPYWLKPGVLVFYQASPRSVAFDRVEAVTVKQTATGAEAKITLECSSLAYNPQDLFETAAEASAGLISAAYYPAEPSPSSSL